MISPALLDIPETFETARMLIRLPLPGDGPAVHAAIVESFDELHRWMPWAATMPTVEQAEETSCQMHSTYVTREDIPLRLIHKESGLILGGSGLHPRGWDVPKFEIGYWCRKRFERQGYITEAVNGILKLGFETAGARRIEIRCGTQNVRSAGVAERVGMKREAELRNDRVDIDGKLSGTLIFGMTLLDWRDLHRKAQ